MTAAEIILALVLVVPALAVLGYSRFAGRG